MTVGDRIKAFAKARFRTQSAFGEAVGMSEQAVSNLVKNRQMPGTETLVRFAAVGMNVNWLLTGVGEMDAKRGTPDAASPAEPPPTAGELATSYRKPTPELLDRAGARPMTPEGWDAQEIDSSPAGIAAIMLRRVLALHERQAERNRTELQEELERIGDELARR